MLQYIKVNLISCLMLLLALRERLKREEPHFTLEISVSYMIGTCIREFVVRSFAS